MLGAAGATVGHASSVGGEDGPDTFNVPRGTAVTATNAGPAVFTAVDPTVGAITVTCTDSTFSGKTNQGLRFGITPPTYTNAGGPCTDNFAFTDTFTSTGKWMVRERDAKNDEGADSTADKMTIKIPQAGLVDVNSVGCTITFAPSGPVNVTGQYDDAGNLSISNASIPVAVSGATLPGVVHEHLAVRQLHTQPGARGRRLGATQPSCEKRPGRRCAGLALAAAAAGLRSLAPARFMIASHLPPTLADSA